MIKNLRMSFTHFLRDQSSLFVFTTVLFLIGVIFGAIVVNALSAGQVTSLNDALTGFFSALNMQETGTDPSEITWQAAAGFLKTTGLLWILGLSIIGLPIIVIVLFVKGFQIGFSVGVIVSQFHLKGLWFALAAILPHNLIQVPALIVCGVAGIAFSLMLVKSRFHNQPQARVQASGNTLYRNFLSYTGLVACIAVAMILAAFVEGYLSPVLMRAVIPGL